MKPYWTSPDGAIVVYHARMEDVLAAGVVDVPQVALVHADPPYGTRMATLQRGRGGVADAKRAVSPKARVRHFPPLVGDGVPFDPAAILSMSCPTVLWGANHYADKVPGSSGWLAWDKREDVGPDDGSDAELAWTNLGGALRVFRHYWRGALRASEKEAKHLHPTQKPIALCSWVYARAKLRAGDLLFVPYLGSGPDLPAARAMGLHVVACDVERWCCDTAIARLGAVTAERAAEPAGPLFEVRDG